MFVLSSFFVFYKQKTANEIPFSPVGPEMYIKDSYLIIKKKTAIGDFYVYFLFRITVIRKVYK